MYEEKKYFRNCYLNGFDTFDPGDLDLWPNDTKLNRVSLLPRMIVWTLFEEVSQGVFELLNWNGFGTFDLGDLWPCKPKLFGFLCYPGLMCGLSLRKVGRSVVELLIEKVTDRPTDWQTDMCKAICPLFIEGEA